MSQISSLYRLQQIDSQLDNARTSLQSLERELSDHSLLEAVQQNITQAEQKRQSELKRIV
jgi:hypothetical protein